MASKSPDSSQGQRTRSQLNTPDSVDLEEFFNSNGRDGESVVRKKDLEAIVPNEEKDYLQELSRDWVEWPYAYAVVFENKKQKEIQYYLVEPYLSENEKKLKTFLKDKIRQSLDYDAIPAQATRSKRMEVISEKTFELMRNYNLLTAELAGETEDQDIISEYLRKGVEFIYDQLDISEPTVKTDEIAESSVEKLNKRQAEAIVYYIARDFLGFERIDGLMHDPKVEDISQPGRNEYCFIDHADHGNIITNIEFGHEDLDQFVTSLAQKAGKGISKQQPDVDATLEDGSRAFFALGDEITTNGSVFDIRKFSEIPFTPIDLINWNTYTIDMMVYLWLAVQTGKSAIIAGPTGSGKTTTLNAISLFIPANEKIVSIEDTREINIPQREWKPTTTRETFGDSDKGAIDEYQLLRNSLRMNPDYVIFGECRGEEGRVLFQNMNTGHTTYSTFHGEGSKEVRNRLTTEPINVDETTFSGLDLIIKQKAISIDGGKKRRCMGIVENDHYDPRKDKFKEYEPFTYDPDTREYVGNLTTNQMNNIPNLIEEIRKEKGWTKPELEHEIKRRRVVLAYLLENELNDYQTVASVVQGYMNDKSNVLAMIGEGSLERELSSLKQMKNVKINASQDEEEQVPRPSTSRDKRLEAESILDNNQELFENINREDPTDDTTTGSRELRGDTYKTETRIIEDEDEPEGEDEDTTPYGYEDADPAKLNNNDTPSQGGGEVQTNSTSEQDSDESIFDGIKDVMDDIEDEDADTDNTNTSDTESTRDGESSDSDGDDDNGMWSDVEGDENE